MKQAYQKVSLIACVALINWSSPETSGDSPRKQKINFYGTLYICTNAKSYEVENISISNICKLISVYETPCKKEIQENKLQLPQDPRKGIVTRLDLSEIAEINVPMPTNVYTFQKNSHIINFIEIEVVSNNPEHTKRQYLIETTRKIMCDEINTAGPIEKEVPMQAFTRLVIKGYQDRDLVERERKRTLKNQRNKKIEQESTPTTEESAPNKDQAE